MLKLQRRRRTLAAPHRQRGVYALEWALVFSVFFILLYALASFGLAFLVRESMQWATEDGARAALQFQDNREARRARAKAVVLERLDWLPGELRASIEDSGNFSFMVCRLNDESSCTANMDAEAMKCDVDLHAPCMLQLRLSLPYARNAYTPSLSFGLLEIAMPDLQAQAQLLVDQKNF